MSWSLWGWPVGWSRLQRSAGLLLSAVSGTSGAFLLVGPCPSRISLAIGQHLNSLTRAYAGADPGPQPSHSLDLAIPSLSFLFGKVWEKTLALPTSWECAEYQGGW